MGLNLTKRKKNVYNITNIRDLYLRDEGSNVLLTLTFLVGESFDDVNKNITQEGKFTTTEEFLLNDYYWLEKMKSSTFRGVSIINIQHDKFDLYLYGGHSEQYEKNENNNKMRIAKNLKKSWWYTLQIRWGAIRAHKDNGISFSESFFSLYDSGNCLIEQSFQNTLIEGGQPQAFFLGGICSGNSADNLVKSKCFTGFLSNLEILKTTHDSIPKELTGLIVKKQTVMNPEW